MTKLRTKKCNIELNMRKRSDTDPASLGIMSQYLHVCKVSQLMKQHESLTFSVNLEVPKPRRN